MNPNREPRTPVDAWPSSRAPTDTWRGAYAALELAQLHTGAARAALYARDGDRLRLLALEGIDQRGLGLVEAMWHAAAHALAQGQPYGRGKPTPTLLLPCIGHGGLAALLLLQWASGTDLTKISGLRPLAQVLAAAVRRLNVAPPAGHRPQVWRGAEELPIADIPDAVLHDAQSSDVALRTLLEQEEWNVTRVARVLGVTRMTIYNRMRRLGVAREHVRKTPLRRRRSALQPTPDASPSTEPTSGVTES